jgi:energy-coupling factor transporter ATP-binding protein EcfA2
LSATPAIEIENLRFAYHDSREAIVGVACRVDHGERVGLVGPNGAGKSTLLLLLVGVLRGEGTIRVGGKVLSRSTLREIRRQVGLVFQDPDDQLFMPTIAEDVAFGPAQTGLTRDELDKRVEEALESVGMAGFGPREPHHLSGGEKRAASLATVLSMRPEILALDEPTTGLDPRSRRRVIELLKRREQTLLVATHDLEMVLELCGRVVLLDEGKVVSDGPARNVLSDESLMEVHGLEVPLSIRLGGRPEQ